jgi:hypothetical protein
MIKIIKNLQNLKEKCNTLADFKRNMYTKAI